jgi:hypothetical protein
MELRESRGKVKEDKKSTTGLSYSSPYLPFFAFVVFIFGDW